MGKYAFICLLLAIASCHAADGDIVAKAGDEPIYKARFENALKFELSKYDPKIINDPERIKAIKKTLLDEMIKAKILFSAAKNANIGAGPDELAQEYALHKSRYTEASFQKMLELKGIKHEDWKEDKKEEYIIDKLIQQEVISKINIADSDIKKYYNKHRKDFAHGDEVHARQILLDDAKQAEEILRKAAAGENFAALAQEFSIAPEGKRGGDLGWFKRGVMPKAFDEACFPLPTGSISPVVKTEFGYHIFKVLERRSEKTLPLDEVKDKVIARMQQERSEDAFNKWYEQIRSKTKVEIYENI